MRTRAFVQRLVLIGVLAGAIAAGATTLLIASADEQGVPVGQAAPLGPQTPPAGAKPAPAPAPAAAAGVIFRDEFTKPSLDPVWKVELEDKERLAIDGGELVLITQPRVKPAAEGESGVKNRVVLNRDLQGDFTITARLSVAIVRPGNTVGMAVRTADGAFVVIGFAGYTYGGGDYRRVFLGKQLGGQYAQLTSGDAWDDGKPSKINLDRLVKSPETIWLRLEKQRFTYTGSYSFDGTRFETIGQQLMVRNDGARLELFAYDVSAGVETGARFDLVEVVR